MILLLSGFRTCFANGKSKAHYQSGALGRAMQGKADRYAPSMEFKRTQPSDAKLHWLYFTMRFFKKVFAAIVALFFKN